MVQYLKNCFELPGMNGRINDNNSLFTWFFTQLLIFDLKTFNLMTFDFYRQDSSVESYIYLKEYWMYLNGGDSSVDSYILGKSRWIQREYTIISKGNQDDF